MPTNLHKVTQYHWNNDDPETIRKAEVLINFDYVVSVCRAEGISEKLGLDLMTMCITKPAKEFSIIIAQSDIEAILEKQNA